MENTSRMRIICDPFKKQIEYQWFDSNIEEYTEFDPENSKLATEELMNTTIQNRAYEIVGIISNECNVGNAGLEIIFIGTDVDYTDFCNVLSNYYPDANITCIRDDLYYNTDSFVISKIKDKFSDIKTTLEEYMENDIAKMIDKYNDAVKPSISLCIMGLYSSGKSAFINSIIGAEVLPSASDPTTAKVCKIFCDKKYQIRFWFDDKECVLTFEGTIYKPNSSFDKEIIKELQNILDTDRKNDEIFHMNRALAILNNYSDEKHKIGDIIEIYIPFKKTELPINEFDFVIYDTPGSNSANNVSHFEVLKSSLDEQTNALPILLTTPDTMDATDNVKILHLIEDTGAALDTTNAIIIVNKADEKGKKALDEKKKKCQSLGITKWKSTRIFFLSSLLGIASKKNDPDNSDEWIDEDMFEIYGDKKFKFVSDDRKLFEYNIVDQCRMDDIIAYKDANNTTHLYKNSGLESVEREIIEYARRYALYNKCQQASGYLQQAISLCVDNLKEVETKLNEALDETKKHFDSKKRRLCDNLESKKKVIPVYNMEFQQLMEKDFSDFTKRQHLEENSYDRYLQDDFKEKWKELNKTGKKENKGKNWAINKIQEYVDTKYNLFLNLFSDMANTDIVPFWDRKSNLFKTICRTVVHDSIILTDEQKEILDKVILSQKSLSKYKMEFNLRSIGAIRNKRFIFVKRKSEKFDAKKCSDQFVKCFNDAVRKRITATESLNEKYFKEWADSLINTLTKELCKFNSDLSSYMNKIEDLNQDIETKRKCHILLTESKEYIDNLLDIQEADNDE